MDDVRPSEQTQTSQPKPFNLLRWFSALSLVTILVTGAGMAWFLTHYLNQQMLIRDAEVSRDFIESIVHTENSVVSHGAEATTAQALLNKDVLNAFIEHIPKLPHVTRANLYSPDRTIIWSSDPRIVGRRFDNNDELETALQDRIVVESGRVTGDAKPEHVGLADSAKSDRFIEAYLPIRDEAREHVIGVVEIYKLPKELFQAIDRGIRIVWASAAAGGLVLYLALFGIVRRADMIMRSQRDRLIESETMSAIGEMAAAVAHSIRNPLASIRSAAELALEEDSTGQAECMHNIMGQADRLDGWVRELLAASRGGILPVQSLDVNELVRESLDGAASEIQRRGIDLAVEQAPLPAVRGTRALAHAIRSILSNAVEAMPEGGRLRIESRSNGHGEVQILIEDTGPGMPAEVARQAFRPLFTTKPNGLGLGLTLARRILERHAGRLDFESQEGRGTRVVMSLPALSGAPRAG